MIYWIRLRVYRLVSGRNTRFSVFLQLCQQFLNDVVVLTRQIHILARIFLDIKQARSFRLGARWWVTRRLVAFHRCVF